MNRRVFISSNQQQRYGCPGIISARMGMGLFLIFCLMPVIVWTAEPRDHTFKAINDPAIALAVENEIRTDGIVTIDPIDIPVHEGIVTYQGTVRNLLAKERATKLAETVRGVRAVVNQLQVVPSIPSTDSAVKQRIVEELESDSVINPETFQIGVQEGIVTVEGHVASWGEKFIAGKIVKRVEGVKGIHNTLVRMDVKNRPDSDIKREVVKRLKYDVWVPEEALEVRVDQGNVILTGTVGSAFAKRQALQDSWSAGVKDVNGDGIRVNPDVNNFMKRARKPKINATNIQEGVIDAILYDSRVVNFPKVDVTGGVVTLTGHVNNLQAKRAAEEDARNTVGVWYVRNYLKVRPPESLTDPEIADYIRDAWRRNPYLTRWGMDVTVFNGSAYLAGTVGSFFQKEQAEETASRVKGVTKVLNRLQVNAPWQRKDDAEIQEDVEEQLWWSPFVDSERITVSVNSGIVTLKGTVKTWQERRIATQNAYEGGARRVHNALDVEYSDKKGRKILSTTST